MEKLNKETLIARREFLRQRSKLIVAPVVMVYMIGKMTPPVFGACRPEPR